MEKDLKFQDYLFKVTINNAKVLLQTCLQFKIAHRQEAQL